MVPFGIARYPPSVTGIHAGSSSRRPAWLWSDNRDCISTPMCILARGSANPLPDPQTDALVLQSQVDLRASRLRAALVCTSLHFTHYAYAMRDATLVLLSRAVISLPHYWKLPHGPRPHLLSPSTCRSTALGSPQLGTLAVHSHTSRTTLSPTTEFTEWEFLPLQPNTRPVPGSISYTSWSANRKLCAPGPSVIGGKHHARCKRLPGC